MRNRRGTGIWLILTLAWAVAGGGCVPPDGAGDPAAATAAGNRQPVSPPPQPPKPQKPLNAKQAQQALAEAYSAFGRRDLDAAQAGADRVLAANPSGPGAAEAQYLRGRVFEERATRASDQRNVPAARAALQSAREAYNAALAANPAPNVEGNARAGIANVAYFQEDYATAIAQWTVALDRIAEPATRSWILYRIGLSQQRFGNFGEADKTFAAVQQQFPGTEPARRAAAHQGARGFFVQVGVYATPANADAAIAALKSEGVAGTRQPDPAGRHVVRVGPLPNYEQAKSLKARVASRYPDAMVVP